MKIASIICLLILTTVYSDGQSGRVVNYSESKPDEKSIEKSAASTPKTVDKIDDDVIRVDTDLVTIPVQISEMNGKPVVGIKKEEFKIFENEVEQEVVYFSSQDQPLTVTLVLDMSYSSVFKLSEIQNAALEFIGQLNPADKVSVVSFDEKPHLLCGATNNRKILKLAVEGAQIGSGTSLYTTLDSVLNDDSSSEIPERKAVILLSDGVDTKSAKISAADVLKKSAQTDVLVYPIQYDTFFDVQKSRKDTAPIYYDDNDRPYSIERQRVKGEREEDYKAANEFLGEIAGQSGGRLYRVSSLKNLNRAFTNIVEELRKVYSLGYYSNTEHEKDVKYQIKVRVYRPHLLVRSRNGYILKRQDTR